MTVLSGLCSKYAYATVRMRSFLSPTADTITSRVRGSLKPEVLIRVLLDRLHQRGNGNRGIGAAHGARGRRADRKVDTSEFVDGGLNLFGGDRRLGSCRLLRRCGRGRRLLNRCRRLRDEA